MDTTSMTRPRLLGAAALLALTTVAGAMSRGGKPTPPPPGTLSFSAPDGGPVTFTGQLDRSAVRVGGDGRVRMELVLAGEKRAGADAPRVPTDLVVVLDRSGSMGGEKITHARAAVDEVVNQLGAQDRFALVTYSDGTELTIPLTPVTDDARRAWLAAVDRVAADGGTNMSAGLDLALDTATRLRAPGRAGRVILISDGLANQGDASHEGLVGRARRAAGAGLPLTTVGVGADFNEYLMTDLADAGSGNYYYLEHTDSLASVFARELGATRTTVASGVTVDIAPAPGVHVVDAAGYPLLATTDGHVTFRPGTLFAGQERRIWVTLDVPHDAPATHPLGRFAVSFDDHDTPHTLAFTDTPEVACVGNDADFFARVDRPAWERSVLVEGFNKMQADVAVAVKEGRQEAAQAAVDAYKKDTEAMNRHVASAPVAQRLRSLDELKASIDDAFQGRDQKAKQNTLSKGASLSAVDGRRQGAKY
jgi:Ca-activated chloride channel family protein